MSVAIDPFLIAGDNGLRQAMQQLEETEERILFVVDEDSRMLGSLTDGDIRRWILADRGLDASIERLCNTQPHIVDTDYGTADVRDLMLAHNLSCVPVLDTERRIVDLLFWSRIFGDGSPSPIRQPIHLPVVIMAGGRGTRLDPFTRILPKPLIPIGDKAVVEIIIESFTNYGVNQFILAVNHKANVIRSFFEDLAPAYSIRYLEENEPLGTAGALRMLSGEIEGPLIVTNCDIIIRADYSELVRTHVDEAHDITVVASMKSYNIPYGVCELAEGGCLERIVEKPEYDMLVNTGMYVLEPETLELIPENERFDATDLIDAVLARGGRVGVYPISERAWLDIGEWAEYRRTVQALGT